MTEPAPKDSLPQLDAFCAHLALERRVSEYTVRNYRHAVENFVTCLQEQGKWKDDFAAVRALEVRSFLIDQGRRVSRRTLQVMRRMLRRSPLVMRRVLRRTPLVTRRVLRRRRRSHLALHEGVAPAHDTLRLAHEPLTARLRLAKGQAD